MSPYLLTPVLLVLSSMTMSSLAVRPRGVRVELASLYNPSQEFSCFDGSNTIPFMQVNDDYCDCDDGSDEPGTSACPEGKFYCENRGHKPLTLPSSRVNDGICDCCDGSDEWDSPTECANTCMEMGRAAREEAAAKAKRDMEGFNIKLGMEAEGKRVADEKSAQLIDLEEKKRVVEAEKDVKHQVKEEAEKPEKEALEFYKQLEEEEKKKKEEEEKQQKDGEAIKVFAELDVDGDGTVSLEELMTRTEFDTNKDGAVSEEEAKFFLSGNEGFSIETFKETGYILVKPYLDLAAEAKAREEVTEAPDIEDLEVPEPEYEETTTGQVTYNERGEEIHIDEKEYDDEDDREEEDEDYDHDDEHPEDEEEEEDDYKPPKEEAKEDWENKYDETTQGLIDAANAARKAFDDADRQLRDVEREIKQLKEVLELDTGDNHAFGPLSGQCFEYTDNEYTYKMCAFDHCSQRGKHGGAETRLGKWDGWAGPEGDKYSKMKFANGQGCWNGPARSSLVHVHCGVDNQLTAVSEPNRCEYEMHFTTPAVCKKPVGNPHDEL